MPVNLWPWFVGGGSNGFRWRRTRRLRKRKRNGCSSFKNCAARKRWKPRMLWAGILALAKFKEGVRLRPDKDDPRDALAGAERLHFGRLPVS